MKNILEQANETIREFEEHLDIADMIEEREKNDDGIRYTLDEVKKIIKEKRSN